MITDLPETLSEELQQAARAMKCPRWNVANGVLDLRGPRFSNLPPLDRFKIIVALPDFRDEETMAHLKKLARAAWNDPALAAVKQGPGLWRITLNMAGHSTTAEEHSEAEAFLFALEQAS